MLTHGGKSAPSTNTNTTIQIQAPFMSHTLQTPPLVLEGGCKCVHGHVVKHFSNHTKLSAHMIGTVVDLVRRGNIEFISGEKRDKIVSFQIPIKTQTHHSHVNWR